MKYVTLMCMLNCVLFVFSEDLKSTTVVFWVILSLKKSHIYGFFALFCTFAKFIDLRVETNSRFFLSFTFIFVLLWFLKHFQPQKAKAIVNAVSLWSQSEMKDPKFKFACVLDLLFL